MVTNLELRKLTRRLMTCAHCGGPLYFTPSGWLACVASIGCGPLIAIAADELPEDGWRRVDLESLWPDRVIEGHSVSKTRKALRLIRNM